MSLWLAALSLLLLFPATRDTLLLQNEAGATIPFVLFMAFSLAPAARVLLLWTKLATHRWVAGARLVRRESLVWALLFFMISLESLIDPALTRWLGYDLTGVVHGFEGDLVERTQRFRTPFLDVLGSAVYSYGYAFVYAGVLGIALLRGERDLARPLLRSFLLVWTVGLPAYLFLPVNEPWYGSASVVNVLHTTIPPSADNPFLAYNINNELPSLHSALSIACATTLWRLGRRCWFWAIALPALSLPAFVVYLGIHWVTDAVTGVALGLAAGLLATRTNAPDKPEIPPTASPAPNGGTTP